MTDSILESVKQKVNLTPDNPEFDPEIIDYINSAFATLHQLGIGPIQGFAIADATAKWDDYLKGDLRFNSVKQYVAGKVRMVFDPPSSGIAVDAMQKSLAEIEVRLSIAREYTVYGLPTQIITAPTTPTNPVPVDTTLNGGTPDDTPSTVISGGTP